MFPNTVAPRDFDTIEVPFPERGPAALLRWADRQARERAQAEANQKNEKNGGAAGGGEEAKAPQPRTETVTSP